MENLQKLGLFLILIFLISQCIIFNVKAQEDPIFGYDIKGTSSSTFSANYLRGTKFYCSEAGTANSITLYVKTGALSPIIKCAIYTDNNNYPDALIGYTEECTLTSGWDDWKTLNIINGGSLNEGYYWLIFWNTATTYFYYATGDTNQSIHKSLTYNSFPTSFPTGGSYYARQYSIYCTYTTEGGKTWHTSAIWNLNLTTKQWFTSAIWNIDFTIKAWHNTALWNLLFQTSSWHNIIWNFNLQSFGWHNIFLTFTFSTKTWHDIIWNLIFGKTWHDIIWIIPFEIIKPIVFWFQDPKMILIIGTVIFMGIFLFYIFTKWKW